MKDVGIVQGSAAMAQPLVVGTTTVYVHDNIVKLDKDAEGNPTDNLYEYHEVQYSTEEYIGMQSEEISTLSETLDDVLTNVLPELIGGEE